MTIHEFELLYKSYYHVVFHYCSHFNLPKEETEDVIMNVFEKILCDLPKYRVQGIKSFIVTSAKNQCMDIVRHNKSKHLHLQRAKEEIYDAREQIEKTEARRYLLSVIQQLPHQQQRVIELKYMHDKTRKEMAACLNLSPNTIRNTLADGIKNIKKKLK